MDRQRYHASSWSPRARAKRHAESLGLFMLLVEESSDDAVLAVLELTEGSCIPSVRTLRRQST